MEINNIITEYLNTKQAERDAKKRADALKALILQHAGDADNFVTDEYTVIIKTTESTRLDTAAIYRDFPDIKGEYGKTTTSKTVDAVRTACEHQKSA